MFQTFNEKISYSCHNVSKCFRKKFNGISGIPSFSDAICQSFINWQANTSAVVNSASEEKTGKILQIKTLQILTLRIGCNRWYNGQGMVTLSRQTLKKTKGDEFRRSLYGSLSRWAPRGIITSCIETLEPS